MRRYLIVIALTLSGSVTLHAADIPTNIVSAVAATERSDKDRERDTRDRPSELMAFAGIAPGMNIADVFGGGGYWTELMARAVGPKDQVRLVNNAAYAKTPDLRLRFASNRLPNTEVQIVKTDDLKLGRNTFDMIVIFMSYHDLYWVDEKQDWPAINASGFLDQLQAALKPGGRLLIVDHAAVTGTKSAAAQNLHRIEESFAKQDIESHGFKLEKTWDGYRNPSDDLSKLVYLPAVRGKTEDGSLHAPVSEKLRAHTGYPPVPGAAPQFFFTDARGNFFAGSAATPTHCDRSIGRRETTSRCDVRVLVSDPTMEKLRNCGTGKIGACGLPSRCCALRVLTAASRVVARVSVAAQQFTGADAVKHSALRPRRFWRGTLQALCMRTVAANRISSWNH